MPTLLEILQKSSDFLASKSLESPRLNAEILIGHALKLKRMQLYLQFERNLTEPELALIRPLLKRRSTHEPLQYITGSAEWCGLTLKTDRRALIPRPETEYLIELLSQKLPAPPANILDLGTGTAAIAIAIAKKFPDARITATDASADALALAAENISAHDLSTRISLINSNWFASLDGNSTFDLIVSNPPYLAETELTQTAPEVRDYEPRSALVAPDNGLADLLQIISTAPKFLSPVGTSTLALETGPDQHPALIAAAQAAGFSTVESLPDLAKRPRFIIAQLTRNS